MKMQIILVLFYINFQSSWAQVRFEDMPYTFLVPPSFEGPRMFNNVQFQNQKLHVKIPLARNMKNDYYLNFEHQTDWIPIISPNIMMEKKNDKILHEQIPAASDRRAKILAGYHRGTNKKPFTSMEVKTFDNSQRDNRHSFVYFKKLLDPKFKQRHVDLNRTTESSRLTENDDNSGVFNAHENLSEMLQAKLDDLLKNFELNISKILDKAVLSNASDFQRNRVQRSQHFEHPDIFRSNGVPTEFIRPLPYNTPPISGASLQGLIKSNHWTGSPTEAGYTSPPNLDDGTLDYVAEHSATQEIIDGSDSTIHKSIQQQQANNWNILHNNTNKLIDKQSMAIVGISESHKSNVTEKRNANYHVEETINEFDNNVNNQYIQNDKNLLEKGIDVKDNVLRYNTAETDVKRKLIVESLSKLNEATKVENNERNKSVVDEDGRVEETIEKTNRVSKRMFPLYTSVSLKGIDTFHPGHSNSNNDLIDNIKGINLLALDQFRREHKINLGYNSLDHYPPDPLVSLFLSHYGRYIPSGHLLSPNFRNIYSYLASNNIHNNKPFGSYKIYEDSDG